MIFHQGLIPVAACSEYGRFDPTSNFRASIGNKEVVVPRIDTIYSYDR